MHPQRPADNAAWPTALPLAFNSPATLQDVLEVDGRARWYRFPISPNQRITVNLSGLSSDYELAVFRDIGAEFAVASSCRRPRTG